MKGCVIYTFKQYHPVTGHSPKGKDGWYKHWKALYSKIALDNLKKIIFLTVPKTNKWTFKDFSVSELLKNFSMEAAKRK